jgi:hypothetical protein
MTGQDLVDFENEGRHGSHHFIGTVIVPKNELVAHIFELYYDEKQS